MLKPISQVIVAGNPGPTRASPAPDWARTFITIPSTSYPINECGEVVGYVAAAAQLVDVAHSTLSIHPVAAMQQK